MIWEDDPAITGRSDRGEGPDSVAFQHSYEIHVETFCVAHAPEEHRVRAAR